MTSREVSFRYNLLRGGAFCGLLQADMSTAPTVRMDDGSEIKTAFSALFHPQARDVNGRELEINWLSDEIQPVMIVDGVKYPLGVFMPATPVFETDTAERVSVQCYDRCWRVRDTRSERLLYWPRNTGYLDAIGQLLNEAGIRTVFAVPSTEVFAEPREDWEIGESYLTVINQLLGEINYNPLWFDASGNAVLEPASAPEASRIEHVFDANDPDTLVIPGISRETDIYSAPNTFIVVCANPDKGIIMTARAANENPQSPLSVPRRGRSITQVVRVDNIASQAALQACADRLRNESLLSGETVRIKTGLRPGFGVSDIAALHYGDLTTLCVEHSYSMELTVGGKMQHVLERVVYNLE